MFQVSLQIRVNICFHKKKKKLCVHAHVKMFFFSFWQIIDKSTLRSVRKNLPPGVLIRPGEFSCFFHTVSESVIWKPDENIFQV